VSALLQPGCTRAHAEAVEEIPNCEFCGYDIEDDTELVMTRKGPMHESCAERVFQADKGDSIYPN
jgi:hypothetical protein